jgi:hypothetical protein
MFSTLICVFTLDRIGRRYTLYANPKASEVFGSTSANLIRYWGSIGQGIAMFLAGGMSRAGLNARAAGDIATANQYGAAAASFVYIFTFVFGATWLTVPW